MAAGPFGVVIVEQPGDALAMHEHTVSTPMSEKALVIFNASSAERKISSSKSWPRLGYETNNIKDCAATRTRSAAVQRRNVAVVPKDRPYSH